MPATAITRVTPRRNWSRTVSGGRDNLTVYVAERIVLPLSSCIATCTAGSTDSNASDDVGWRTKASCDAVPKRGDVTSGGSAQDGIQAPRDATASNRHIALETGVHH